MPDTYWYQVVPIVPICTNRFFINQTFITIKGGVYLLPDNLGVSIKIFFYLIINLSTDIKVSFI